MAEPLFPAKIKPGDKIRFISPASTPDRDLIQRRADHLREMGFEVDFGAHAFAEHGFYAGTHEQRLSDLNAALSDPFGHGKGALTTPVGGIAALDADAGTLTVDY